MPLLEMKSITKRFSHVIANDNIDFTLEKGEVHVLLGENGAGKSTLINILSGIYSPDEGEIRILGKKMKLNSPAKALSEGIGVVYQHFHLSKKHSVFENIILNHSDVGIFINSKKLKKKITDLMNRIDLHVDLDSKIWQLPVSEQQKVEIIKVLFHGVCILVLDEPTAVLSPIESEKLHKIILKLRNENHAIIMITHKLNEVMKIGDRVTILRRGKKVITLDVKNLNKDELTSHMINSDCKTISSKTSTNTSNEVLLKIHDLNVINARGLKAVSNLSFEIHKNEIFGIAGVSGQGQIELAEAIYGLKEYTGMITLSGKNYKNRSASLSLLEKVAYIPADRLKFGIAKTLSISENLMLKTKLPVNKTKLLNYKKIQKMSEELIEKFQIDGNSNVIAGNLSGGNIQKVILARELELEPELIIAVYPLRGLDIASCEFVRSRLLAMKEKGAAILLISEEIDEILEISDRVGVMLEGEMNGIIETASATPEWIGKRMAEKL